jgi:exonuclease I
MILAAAYEEYAAMQRRQAIMWAAPIAWHNRISIPKKKNKIIIFQLCFGPARKMPLSLAGVADPH